MKHIALLCTFFCSAAMGQTLTDSALQLNIFTKGLNNPTGAVFLNSDGDALITQKNDGKVLLVHQRLATQVALDLPVANESERGLLSIALSPNFATDKRVYLYHTAAKTDGGEPISNKISRYVFNGRELVFDRKIIDLPVSSGPNHDGGKIAFDAKGKLYVVVGDLNRNEVTSNFESSGVVSRRSAILRIEPSGGQIKTNPFASQSNTRTATDDIFAYGIRNSFGIAFDPVTGNLWDTENGPDKYDEINRVDAGFNSGWEDIMGPRARVTAPGALASLGAKSHYRDPEFSWVKTVGPTDLHFINSGRLGESFRNDMIIGDVNTGTLFHFDLNAQRNGLSLSGVLADKVADNSAGDINAEQSSITFGTGFGVVSDLLDGPGGMFALSLTNGTLYRISQRTPLPQMRVQSLGEVMVPEPGSAGIVVSLILLWSKRRDRRGK